MGSLVDLTGCKFGKLTVLRRAESRGGVDGKKRTFWLCQCECGKIKEFNADNLRRGRSHSCGCERDRKSGERFRKHGLSNTRLYYIYNSMIQRCENPKEKEYKNYGGRGIKVCDEWKGDKGFISFFCWAKNNGYDETLSIDRKDNNGNYCPDNCRWADRKTQANNTSRTLRFDVGNGLEPFALLCERYGISRGKAWKRLKRGWPIKDALEK